MSAPIKPFYGVHSSQEHRKEDFLRDIRPFHERFFAALTSRDGCSGAILLLCLASLWQPALFPFLTLASCLLFLIRKSACRLDVLSMRTPMTWQGCDYADLTPLGAPRKTRGSFFLDNAMETSKELWIARDDLLTHMLVLGTTGAGKTETLVSLSFNCLAQGSGLMYLDPKAAPKLAAQIYTMCRTMGRDDAFPLKRHGTVQRDCQQSVNGLLWQI